MSRRKSKKGGGTPARGRAALREAHPALTGRFGGTPEMDAVIGETVALFHRIRHASQQLQRRGQLSAGLWGLLRDLDLHGPQTVPHLARKRPVSRQYVQMLADELAQRRLVEFFDNPNHKRSLLVRLTTKGKGVLDEMNLRAVKVFQTLTCPVADEDLRRTAGVLRAVRQMFEGKAWDQALKAR